MPLSLDDRLQIQDLLIRYTYLADYGCTEEEFLSIFTEDAVLESPISGVHVGVEGVREMARKLIAGRGMRQFRHYATNFHIEGDGDEARLRAHMLQFVTPLETHEPGAKLVTEFLYTGNYDCRVRRVNGRWRIASRTVIVDSQLS